MNKNVEEELETTEKTLQAEKRKTNDLNKDNETFRAE